MDIQKQAELVKALMAEGMSLDKALEKVLKESQAPKEWLARIEYIRGLENIELLQTLNKRAHAKLSSETRGKAKPEALKRYTTEVKETKLRLDYLRAKVGEGPTSLQELIKLEAKPSSVIQLWLKQKEEAVEPLLLAYKGQRKLTNPQLKAAIASAPMVLPKEFLKELEALGEVYQANVSDRLSRGDQRIGALIRKWNLVK